jgi:alkylation response protein AidB-like acyl-CoA dehydrogenase
LRRYGDESSVPTEFPVERYYRDAKSYQIVEGSSNIFRK